MVLDAVSNFVRGTADAAVGTDDTTVSVEDASIFPDPATDGEFNVVIWDVANFPRPDQDGDVEILRVTERDTTADELTVTRGQEMTSAAAHPEGSAIHLSPTAKMFSDIESTFGDFWDAGTQELTADVNNTNTTTQTLEAGSLSTESLVTNYHYAGAYDGADADERLDNALSAASDSDVIYLEADEYSVNRTINTEVQLVGPAGLSFNPLIVTGEWTLASRTSVENLSFNADLTVDADRSIISMCVFSGGDINVNVDRVRIIACRGEQTVTFASDTSNSIVDGSISLSVTDNGSNTVGDIA